LKGEASRYDRQKFQELLLAAFLESHERIVRRFNEEGWRPSSFYGYPSLSRHYGSGLPSIDKSHSFGQNLPQFSSGIRPPGLLGLILDHEEQPEPPAFVALVAWCDAHKDFREYFGSEYGDSGSRFALSSILHGLVDRYFLKFNIGPLDDVGLAALVEPILRGIFPKNLALSLVVPIALTHFDVPRFKLNDLCYIFRMGDPLHLARARADYFGSGVPFHVAAAASHAFVWRGWTIANESYWGTTRALMRLTTYPTSDIDNFFAALRTVSGIDTGYAQIMFLPKGWSLSYDANLPSVFGVTSRRYPSHFDDYGWSRENLPLVDYGQLGEVQRIFNLLLSHDENRLSIAVKRLNSCLTRDDGEDAIIDATVGLEVLLGDPAAEAISWKLKMRAAALAGLANVEGYDPHRVLSLMNEIYAARSKIVHGNQPKSGRKQKLETLDVPHQERGQATMMLRFMLTVLLDHPAYLDPLRIDRELLLGKT